MVIKCPQGIVLRSITEKDTDNILRWRNSEMVMRYFNHQQPITSQEHSTWLKDKVQAGYVHQFIVHSEALNKDVGSVYIKNIDSVSRKAEYGVFIGEQDAIGRGIGTIVAKAMINYAFRDLNLHKLYLQVLATNSIAIKCYNKAGFHTEAVLKDHIFVNDSYCDLAIMSTINGNSPDNA